MESIIPNKILPTVVFHASLKMKGRFPNFTDPQSTQAKQEALDWYAKGV